jgi:phage anti-repressor protein
MDKLMETHVGTAEVEEEIVHDPFTLDMDIVSAIRLVQKNERGRQGRYRIMLILKNLKQKKLENEMNRKIREGLVKE